MPEQKDKFARYALVLLVVGALGRLLLLTLPRPFYSSVPPFDGSYIETAQDILRFNFHALGDRVPVYPLLVALCGLNPRAIWVAQSILGVAASLMIFDMAFRRTRHGLCSLLIGLAGSLIPEILVYEASIGTEELTNFFLVASLWLFTRCDGAGESNIRYPLGLGLTVALAGLTRPLMICLVPVYYCFLVPLWPPAKILRRENIKKTLSFALPVIVFILGWCGFNYLNNGYFSPTTRAGQQLMDQVDPYVDLAPDRFAVLRDIWLQSREQSSDYSIGTTEYFYGSALPEMERRTGKTEIQVSHELASLALYLEIHHPLYCLRRAEQGWIQFWGEPFHDEVAWPQGGKIRLTEFLTAIANFLVREIKAAFLVLALLSIPCALFRLKAFTRLEYLTFAIALWVSAFGAFTEFGNNRRFCVPLYMLIIYTVLTRVWLWITATSSQGAGATSD
ncbi:MAG: hypothetical protein ABSA41_20265 [Terriglobia bacterium]